MGFILNTSFQPTSGFLNLNVSTAPTGYSVNYAIVGGGGGGGGNWGGGGGAGQVVQSITTLQSNTLYVVNVGDGAIGTNVHNNLQGKSSSFAGVTAIGGGSGGNGVSGYTNGNNGGSGGGACSGYSLNLTNTLTSYGGTATSGYAGGDSIAPRISGGGGGAGSIGGSGTLTGSGNGGAGIAITITGYSAGTFAGGGGGGAGQAYTAGNGGSGGGGNGAVGVSANGGNATANTGSGGGGGGWYEGVGGSGGSGIVILSIPTANYSGDAYVNGGVIDNSVWTKTTSGSNTILTFLKSSLYQSGSSANNAFNINSLVVGGGGGGSDDNATGGGSGGYVVSKNILTIPGIVFTINVGIGGYATQWNTNNGNNNVSSESTSGQPSTISFYRTITANGGASGLTNVNLGGYGGGNVNPPTNDPDPNSSPNPIDGGIGIVSSITGVPTYYAGGGSGNNFDTGGTPSPGAGLIGQGGGGGVHGNVNYAQNGQNGVVILSIPTSKYTGITTGNPAVTTDGAGNTILTYNNSGTYTS